MDCTPISTADHIRILVREKVLSDHPFLPTDALNRMARDCFEAVDNGIKANEQSMKEAKSRSNLMLLPAEIRNRILGLVLTPEPCASGEREEICNNTFHLACEPYMDHITARHYVKREALRWQTMNTKARFDDEICIQHFYRDYYLYPQERWDPRTQSPIRTKLPAITQVSRQLRDEAASVYYGSRVFTAYWNDEHHVTWSSDYSAPLVWKWLHAIGHENRAKIRRLELRYVGVQGHWQSRSYRRTENIGRASKWVLHELFPDLKQESVQIMFCFGEDTDEWSKFPIDWRHPQMPYKLKEKVWRKLGDHGFPTLFITDGSPDASVLRGGGYCELAQERRFIYISRSGLGAISIM